MVPHAIATFVRSHRTYVQIGVYVAAFAVCMLCIQKIDDYGSAWRKQNVGYMNCTVTTDGTVLSPVCNAAEVERVNGTAWQPSTGTRPGFCTPHAPWFWYDLGGTMCVCEKKWERRVYWEKVMTSFAFNFPHFMTPFQIYIVYQRWQWVFMYISFNEVFEEICLAVTGKWGFTFDPPYDLEPRYDSLIRDVFLCGIPGLIFGMVFVYVMKVPRFMLSPLHEDWEASGRHSKKYHLKVLFQMLALKQIALVYNTDRGVSTFYPQNVILITMNLTLVFSFYLHNRKDWGPHCQGNVARFHGMWAFFSMGIWSLTVYPLLDELYLLCVAIACSYLMLLAIFTSTRNYNCAATWMLGVPVHVACMSVAQYEDWVDGPDTADAAHSADRTSLLEITTLLDLIAVHSDKGNTHISMHEMASAYSTQTTEVHLKSSENSTLLPDAEASPTESFLKVGLDAETPSTAPFSTSAKLRCLCCGFACMLLLQFGWSEPYTYTGLMYRRHWCGLIMADGGNGCLIVRPTWQAGPPKGPP